MAKKKNETIEETTNEEIIEIKAEVEEPKEEAKPEPKKTEVKKSWGEIIGAIEPGDKTKLVQRSEAILGDNSRSIHSRVSGVAVAISGFLKSPDFANEVNTLKPEAFQRIYSYVKAVNVGNSVESKVSTLANAFVKELNAN